MGLQKFYTDSKNLKIFTRLAHLTLVWRYEILFLCSINTGLGYRYTKQNLRLKWNGTKNPALISNNSNVKTRVCLVYYIYRTSAVRNDKILLWIIAYLLRFWGAVFCRFMQAVIHNSIICFAGSRFVINCLCFRTIVPRK